MKMEDVIVKIEGFLETSLDGKKPKPASEFKLKLPLNCGLINLKAETDLGIKFSNLENGLISLRHQMSETGKYGY
jgi:hypothetical protein